MNFLKAEKNRRILIIDDNRSIHDDFRKILIPGTNSSTDLAESEAALFGNPTNEIGSIEFEVDSAYQGQEGALLVGKAIEEGRPYAMAVVDMRMPPGWDGVETIEAILKIDSQIQIVICTAYSEYSWREMLEKLGHRDGLLILKKPFDTVEASQLAHALTEKWWLHQQSQRKMEELESRVVARTAELAKSLSLLNATFDSTTDGIVAVDLSGKIVSFNTRFADTWQFPDGMLARRDVDETRAHTARQIKDPAKFLQRIEELKHNPEAEGCDEIGLKDGRIFERYVFPQRIDHACVGTVINWRDVTERKGAEAVLRNSKRFLQSTLDALSSHIAILDESGTIIEVNAAWNRFARENNFRGTKCGVGDNYLKVCESAFGKFSEEAVKVVVGIRAVMAGERDEFHLEYPCHSPREQRWFIVRATRFDGDGPVRLVVAHENITERKQSEISGDIFSKLGRNLSTAASPEKAAQMIGEAASDLLGWDACYVQLCTKAEDEIYSLFDADTVDGKRITNTMHRSKTTTLHQRILKSGAELVLRDNPIAFLPGANSFGDKSRPSASLMFVPIRNRSRNVGVLSIQSYTPNAYTSQNLATLQALADQCGGALERIWADEALRKSELQFRGVWDTSTDGMRLANRDGIVLIANDAYCRMAGKTKTEIEGHPISIIQRTERADRILERHAQQFDSSSIQNHLEKEVTLWNDKKVWFELSNSLIEMPGQPSLMLSIFRDVTERKQIEARLFQSQKMETVGQLAGGVAHEFNSILTAIIGQSELLLNDLPQGSALANNATEISKAAGRAAMLTRQLLAYGRKQFLQPETLDLNRILAGMESMLPHLMGSGVDTRIIAMPGLQMVKVDAGQIEQVIMNIAINARDAMPNGGRLTLETATISFAPASERLYAELKPGDYVMLAITDTGIGMNSEVMARIFEPFFTTKGVGQGTGLGLSTCYGIIKQSGGHISVYSEPSLGTTFKIYLPQAEPLAKLSIQSLDSPDLPRGTETILLVEDDPALREMAATLLKRLGYNVFSAANGVEALSLKRQHEVEHIDLLFTDVVMPHMSGKELADRVRSLYPHTKVLFASAYTENAIVHQGVLDKGVALLQKPFTPSALAQKLRAVLDSTKRFDKLTSRNI